MTDVRWPAGYTIEQVAKSHKRNAFQSGVASVDDWLKKRARQAQDKHLSVTRVLLNPQKEIVGYYTLAMGQVNFDELPPQIMRKLPATLLPILTLAWLGVDKRFQSQGFGERLLAQALCDCHTTGKIMPFIAVLLDCITPGAKRFYQHYDFKELPGHPMTLMLPWNLLDAMMTP